MEQMRKISCFFLLHSIAAVRLHSIWKEQIFHQNNVNASTIYHNKIYSNYLLERVHTFFLSLPLSTSLWRATRNWKYYRESNCDEAHRVKSKMRLNEKSKFTLTFQVRFTSASLSIYRTRNISTIERVKERVTKWDRKREKEQSVMTE